MKSVDFCIISAQLTLGTVKSKFTLLLTFSVKNVKTWELLDKRYRQAEEPRLNPAILFHSLLTTPIKYI